QHCCRAVLLDQRRAGDLRAGAKVFAPIKTRCQWRRGGTEIELALARDRRRPVCCEARKSKLWPLADGAEPEIDELDRFLRRMMRIALLIQSIKSAPDGLPVTAS